MIRECFNLKIGIIFDEHMLMNEVGLDIGSLSKVLDSMALDPTPLDPTEPDSTPPLSKPPNPILPGTRPLDRPDYTARLRNPPKTAITLGRSRQGFETKGEAQEELDDALSPIYDQFKTSLFGKIVWKGMDWLPCKFPPSPGENELTRCQKGSLENRTLSCKVRTASGPTNRCESPPFMAPHR